MVIWLSLQDWEPPESDEEDNDCDGTRIPPSDFGFTEVDDQETVDATYGEHFFHCQLVTVSLFVGT